MQELHPYHKSSPVWPKKAQKDFKVNPLRWDDKYFQERSRNEYLAYNQSMINYIPTYYSKTRKQ